MKHKMFIVPRFVLRYIAGAGASNVGIAGSVAVAVVNGSTKAVIEDIEKTAGEPLKYTITAGGDLIIEAVNDQKVITTASGSMNADGSADNNACAGAGAKNDTNSTAETPDPVEAGPKPDNKTSAEVAGSPVYAKSGDEVTCEFHIELVGLGGRVTDISSSGLSAKLEADPMYSMPQVLTYSYEDKEGKTKTGKITVNEDDGEFGFIVPRDLRVELTLLGVMHYFTLLCKLMR